MSMQIWRFELNAENKQTVKMPKDAVILCAQIKGEGFLDEQLSLWAEVNPKAPKEDRVIEVFPTGSDIPTSFDNPAEMGVHRRYIGTVQFRAAGLLFHVYERIS